eukprot:2053367-Heterocapsa_arctica.AAC.1
MEQASSSTSEQVAYLPTESLRRKDPVACDLKLKFYDDPPAHRVKEAATSAADPGVNRRLTPWDVLPAPRTTPAAVQAQAKPAGI